MINLTPGVINKLDVINLFLDEINVNLDFINKNYDVIHFNRNVMNFTLGMSVVTGSHMW